MPTYSFSGRQVSFYFRLFNFFNLDVVDSFFVRYNSLDKLGETLISPYLTMRYFIVLAHMRVEASFGPIALRCGKFPSRRFQQDSSARFSKIVAG